MLKRKILANFAAWQASKNKVALLVKGARQVGKTTSIREFGTRSYEHFIEINFEKTPSARRAFDGDLDARTIIINLSAQGLGPFEAGKTLVFFDEIQSCPAARTAIKFLVEDGRFDFIESGSLLGINYKEVSSYPVGFEEQIDMFPLDFEEFLWANGVSPDVVEVITDAYQALAPVSEYIHDNMMDMFHQYLIVGGMPAAVNAFLANDDLSRTIRIQKIILSNYRDDIAKYAGKDKDKAKAIFDAVPEQLNKKNKRFHLAALEKGGSTRKYEQATNWLADAGIAYHCLNISNLALPLSFSEKRNLYKLYLLDTGLLCAMSMNSIQSALLSGDIKINEGMVAENYVAAVLAKKGIPLYYYDKKTRAELDFVFNDGGDLSVIEVKSGSEYRKHIALDNAIQDNPGTFKRKIVLCKGNIEVSGDIAYLPLYMAMLL
ncbi:MAG: AAA family ATPase [Peptococcaceae bacterium]|jgi:predicted AAA+ superfamily ATPase|nr:AAA family ATPase [Peptococcaceae bacterium]